MLGDKPVNKHTILVDGTEAVRTFDPAAHFNTVPELVGRAHNRLTLEQLQEPVVVNKITKVCVQ
jgi:hypothetical protein